MIQPGTNHAFDMAEAKIKDHLHRMRMYSDLIETLYWSASAETLDLYRIYIENEAAAIHAIVEWCYGKGYVDRSECFNIRHWLFWFDDPNRLDPKYYFFEDFRYD